MSNTQFKLTGRSRIPAGLPARMDVIAALEATIHCDGRQPKGGIDSTNVFVTFEQVYDGDEPFTAYGRVSLHSDNTAIIVPQFEDGIENLGVKNLKAGDTFDWPCGCESIVKDLADLAPAFDGEYEVEVLPNREQQMEEAIGLMAIAKMLGIDTSAAAMDGLLND